MCCAEAIASSVRLSEPPWDADQAMTVLYDSHYPALTRLAALLVGDAATAEEIVQDAFVTMRRAGRRLRDADRALSYLRQTVISRSRSRPAARPSPLGRQPDRPQGGHQAIAHPQPTLLAALGALPARQREALILRYYANLPDAQIAAMTGISARAVKNHIARGMSCLQAILEDHLPVPAPQSAEDTAVLLRGEENSASAPSGPAGRLPR
jgi:RNA polymerase sigma factor (sigma-70 family)